MRYLSVLLLLGLSGGACAEDGANEPAGPGLVIVAPAAFRGALAAFVAHKSEKLSCKLAALEEVLALGEGGDDPERLKRYLFRAWKRDGIGYALLVGDVDVLPVRYMMLDRCTPAAFDVAFYPSDLYYADLMKADGSFESWNGNRDGFHAGYFGEVHGEKNKDGPINLDGIDYRPDLAVGRWPASTAEEVASIAAKTIAFENRAPAPRRAAVLTVGGWVDCRVQMAEMASTLGKRWNAEQRVYGTEPEPTEAEALALWGQGLDLLLHAGHGSPGGWEGCLSSSSIAKLPAGSSTPVLFSAGCSTAYFAPLPPYEAYTDVAGVSHAGTDGGKEAFDSPPPPPAPYQKGALDHSGFAEAMLFAADRGAVAYIGCNTGSQPCALSLQLGFVKAIGGREHTRLGDCWNAAVRYYHDAEHLAELEPTASWYPPSVFFQGMKFMLFGDPTLELRALE